MGEYHWADPKVIDVGPRWMVARLESCDALYNLPVDAERLTVLSNETESVGINVYTIDSHNQVHVRAFAPAAGVFEDKE